MYSSMILCKPSTYALQGSYIACAPHVAPHFPFQTLPLPFHYPFYGNCFFCNFMPKLASLKPIVYFCLFFKVDINEIIQYIFSCAWILSLNLVIVRFIHVVANSSSLLIFVDIYSLLSDILIVSSFCLLLNIIKL